MGLTLQTGSRRALDAIRRALYPQTCVMCEARVETPHGLCADCWAQTPFLTGARCDLCGLGLPGQTDGGGLTCDACLADPPPWNAGFAALHYAGLGRRMVLSLKHGDRTELAEAGARWIHRAARTGIGAQAVFVPVPIHRWRLLKRRYNQSALLAGALARCTGGRFEPEALRRVRATPSQAGRGRAERAANVEGAIAPGKGDLTGAHVALVDDVMASGATLRACADALRAAGAQRITALVLARAGETP